MARCLHRVVRVYVFSQYTECVLVEDTMPVAKATGFDPYLALPTRFRVRCEKCGKEWHNGATRTPAHVKQLVSRARFFLKALGIEDSIHDDPLVFPSTGAPVSTDDDDDDGDVLA